MAAENPPSPQNTQKINKSSILKSWDSWIVKRMENATTPDYPYQTHCISIYFSGEKIHEFPQLVNHSTEVFFFGQGENDNHLDTRDTYYMALHTFGANTGTVEIFEFTTSPSPQVAPIASTPVSAGAEWRKPKGRDSFVLNTQDDNFLDLARAHVDSARPRVILKLEDSRFIPDADLMRTPAPSQKTIEEKVDQYKLLQENENFPKNPQYYPRLLIDPILDFLYAGQSDAAEAFISKALEGNIFLQKRLRKDINKSLSKNPIWQELERQGFKCLD